MNYLENIARIENIDCLTVPSSITAQGFYRKLGYKFLRNEYYGEERIIIMEKKLSDILQNNLRTVLTNPIMSQCPNGWLVNINCTALSEKYIKVANPAVVDDLLASQTI